MNFVVFILIGLLGGSYVAGAILFYEVTFERRRFHSTISAVLWPLIAISQIAVLTANAVADSVERRRPSPPKEESR